jgi:FkbH-like protein
VDLIEHFLFVLGDCETHLYVGEFDSYMAEIVREDSPLKAFGPDLVFLLPSDRRCRYTGSAADPQSQQRQSADNIVSDLLDWCRQINVLCNAEVVIANYPLPPTFDPGPLRHSSLASEYAFKKYVNLELGLSLPSYAHICDLEFLSARRGTLTAVDPKGWFESKQPCAAEFLIDIAREFTHIAATIRTGPKKVLILDLDNTLWGGVIGDDGLDGIELGTTSPRGEAFREFQSFALGLSKRGVLLAVCSKNDLATAMEPFEKHPEMLLRLNDIACFKANWEPKPENILAIGAELNLGLDSFVFVDDNRAEIEAVRRFLPEVSTLWLGDDPSLFVAMLADARWFEARAVTVEDLKRTELYGQEADRRRNLSSVTDMDSYLRSLDMKAVISSFTLLDAPRTAQLINKSNQFNLTTRRRTEAEVVSLIGDPNHESFTVRLSDRYSDHGLIAVVIARVNASEFEIDTWLMSCRVLKRQVEEETLYEMIRRAKNRNCSRITGLYIPTAKNAMVSELYSSLGFTQIESSDDVRKYALDLTLAAEQRATAIATSRSSGE